MSRTPTLLIVATMAWGGCLQLKAGARALMSKDSHIGRTPTVEATAERRASLQVPPGFEVSVWATDLGKARMLAVTDAGDVLVTRPDDGDVLRLRDADGDGRADPPEIVVADLPHVHGLTLHDGHAWLATDTRVVKAEILEDGGLGPLEEVFAKLPSRGRHDQHNLGFGPDGALYVSIGSSCNDCAEEHPLRATMIRIDGYRHTVFAKGLRNTQGFDWHHETGVMWGMDNGSDHRGDDLPPEELNRIEAGNDHGWPYAYGASMVDGVTNEPPSGTKAERAAGSTPMVKGYTAHAAPIAFVFYEGDAFPAEYRDDAFVAMHGSWNRLPPAGYEVVRVVFEDGEPTGFEPFLTGFLVQEDGEWENFGRPAGLAVTPDGALLVSDDTNGLVYRITHGG